MKTKKLSKTKINNGIFNTVIYILLLLLAVIMLYPLIFVLSASFSDPKAVAGGEMLLLPIKPSLEGYRYLMQYKEIWVGYGNTIFYMIAGTLLNLAATLPCAYAMSRKDLKGRKYLMIYFMITMYFSGGMIPSYIVVTRLGLANKLPALFLPMACSAYNLIITKNFMTSLPVSLEESARIDGASDITIFFKIVFPLSKPIMAVMALFYGVGIYNDYFNSVLYISSRELYPLQMLLREMIVANTMQSSMIGLGNLTNKSEIFKMATVVISIVPILCVYPFLQKYFVKGLMLGAVKG